jgi:hypothetical protein
MFGFLRRRTLPPAKGAAANMPPLYFKDAEAAFEQACQYMECPLCEGVGLPALVLDARELFGVATAVKVRPDGNQIAVLRVVSSDGGFVVNAVTAGPKGPALHPGELVWWQAGTYSPEVAAVAKDKRFGWVGLIVGTLKPEYVNGEWAAGERFSR